MAVDGLARLRDVSARSLWAKGELRRTEIESSEQKSEDPFRPLVDCWPPLGAAAFLPLGSMQVTGARKVAPRE